MTIASFQLVPYRLPLDPPFRWRGGEVGERDGVLLRLETTDGRVGWGDASPLPGFSRDSREEAVADLEAILATLMARELDPHDVADQASPLHRDLDAAASSPAARYGVDLALADLAAAELDLPLHRLLYARAADVLSLAALLDGPEEGIVDSAARRAAEGYRALKLKAGRLDPESDAEIARDVRARVGSAVELRVDANRAWTPDQAAAFARLAGAAELAFVEEPLDRHNLADLTALARGTGMPIALDESLADPGGAESIASWVAAVVLKPTVLGGIAAVLRIAERAAAAGARVVLSAAFESGVGMRGVAALAASTGAEPAGLDPYTRLREDVLHERLPFDGPKVDVVAMFARPVAVRDAVPAA